MEERVQQLESEVVEISKSIAQLRHQIEEKKNELKEISNELREREKELRVRKSEALQNLESNVGMYVKVHYIVKEDPEDEDCPRGVEVYLVGKLGKLDAKELAAPIENCISINKNIISHKTMIFNDNYTEITAKMIDNPLVSIEFITKKKRLINLF